MSINLADVMSVGPFARPPRKPAGHVVSFEHGRPVPLHSPLMALPGQRGNLRRAIAYCGYVGCLITVTGLAEAIGVSRDVALNYVGELKGQGRLRVMRRFRLGTRHMGRPAELLEWVA